MNNPRVIRVDTLIIDKKIHASYTDFIPAIVMVWRSVHRISAVADLRTNPCLVHQTISHTQK